jgi:hypothetical protein
LRFLSSWRRPGRVAVVGVTLAMAAAAGFTSPALAGPATASGGVSPTPASGTPELLAPTSTEQNVRQIVQCGSTMYAVGTFTQIKQKGVTHQVNNAFSFSATAPFALTGWAPDVNGTVNSIAFVGGNCADAYLGGQFTSINGTAVRNIAEVNTSTGQVVASFGHTASAQVETLLGYNGHLLVGGDFASINGSKADPYMASLNPSTGKNDGFLNLGISGQVPNGPTKVYNQQLSHSGTLDLVEGNFTSVGGLPRQQIFMLDLSGTTATVTAWTSSEFSQDCVAKESNYVRDAAWSPDDSTVYVADTGLHVAHWNHKFPLTGLCDAAAAFPATQAAVSDDWINYFGCDSSYSVAADSSTVYVGGHMRWSQNAFGCNHKRSGAVSDPGLQGLDPATGDVEPNSSGAPIYSMSRANADDMLLTSAGLWIASSNRFGSVKCGDVGAHSGICFLPYG